MIFSELALISKKTLVQNKFINYITKFNSMFHHFPRERILTIFATSAFGKAKGQKDQYVFKNLFYSDRFFFPAFEI